MLKMRCLFRDAEKRLFQWYTLRFLPLPLFLVLIPTHLQYCHMMLYFFTATLFMYIINTYILHNVIFVL